MIRIYCEKGDGDKEMDEVSDSLLSSEAAAVRRGSYELNSQWYLVHSQSLSVPFKKTTDSTALMDGDIVEISERTLGISGERKVSKMIISGTNDDVSLSLTLQKFEEFI